MIKRNFEIWKQITGLDYYFISNLGRVKSCEIANFGKRVPAFLNERFLPIEKDEKGLSFVVINDREEYHVLYIHHLVLLHFKPPMPALLYQYKVHFKDGDKTNNWSSNLSWVKK